MALTTVIPEDAIQNLAYAVIRQACFDYVSALPCESVKASPQQWEVKECEMFFRSNFFELACPNIDPEWLMQTLRKKRNFRSLWRQKERGDVV
jgi:hypothetical protein